MSKTHYILRGTIKDYTGKYNGEWLKGTVTVLNHIFDLLIGIDNKDIVLIKPSPKKNNCNHYGEASGYHLDEYQRLFGFGCHCDGFNLEKVVDITNAINL